MLMMMMRRRRRRRRKRERGDREGKDSSYLGRTYICSVIEVTIFIFEPVNMQSINIVIELTCFCSHVIVDTRAVVIVVTMQLAVLKISNSFSSYGVAHQTLANEKERSSGLQCTTIIWNKTETNLIFLGENAFKTEFIWCLVNHMKTYAVTLPVSLAHPLHAMLSCCPASYK